MNAAPHQRELVASHIRYVPRQPQSHFQSSMFFLASIWSPFVVPSLVPVSPCSVATHPMPRVLDLEPASKLDDSISSMMTGSPRLARMATGLIGETNGMPTMRHSVKVTHIPSRLNTCHLIFSFTHFIATKEKTKLIPSTRTPPKNVDKVLIISIFFIFDPKSTSPVAIRCCQDRLVISLWIQSRPFTVSVDLFSWSVTRPLFSHPGFLCRMTSMARRTSEASICL